jgi:arylsulfatase A-like enzyme
MWNASGAIFGRRGQPSGHHSFALASSLRFSRKWLSAAAFSSGDHAIAFIKENRDQPFMLWLSWGPPHSANKKAPQEFSRLYDPVKLILRPNVPENFSDFPHRLGWFEGIDDNLEEVRALLAGYYSHISALDDGFGKLRAAIRSMGLDDNAIVVFTSDHGDMLGSHGLWNKQQP